MARVPNPRFSYLSVGEVADLELEADYLRAAAEREAARAKDLEAAAREKREAARARERDKRID